MYMYISSLCVYSYAYMFMYMYLPLQEKEGLICGGGASVYYSHTLQILFFSFQSGKILTQICHMYMCMYIHV